MAMIQLRVVVLGVALTACGAGAPPPSSGPPVLQEIRPAVVGARTAEFQLTLLGTGITPDTLVLIGGTEVRVATGVLGPGPSIAFAYVPGGAPDMSSPGTVSVSLRRGESRSQEMHLAIEEAPAPMLSRISGLPACSGHPPSEFELGGANFTVDTRVEINGKPVRLERLTSTALRFARGEVQGGMPASVRVSVPPPGGGDTSSQLFDGEDCE